jgi:CBS domain-containing protein
MLAGELMTSRVVTVKPGYSVRHAAQLMLQNAVSGLPVIDDEDNLVGMITEGDLLRRIEPAPDSAGGSLSASGYIKAHGWCAGDVMTRQLVTVEEAATVADVARLMRKHGVKCLPVTRGGKLAGIVSRSDLLRVLMMAKPDDMAPGDEAIRRGISARLAENVLLQGNHIDVVVNNGIVFLSGTVDGPDVCAVARMVAENVRGVAGVRDQLLTVERSGGIRDRSNPSHCSGS